MMVRVNGEPAETRAVTIAALLVELGLDPTRRGLAIAVNGKLAPRGQWDGTPVSDGDDIEIVRAMAGG